MFKFVIFILSVHFTVFSGELVLKDKPDINFYEDGKLMWLIDVQRASAKYNMEKIDKSIIKSSIYGFDNYSYENYLLYVNSHKKYRYTNWRLPSIEELKSIGLKDTFHSNLRVKHFTMDANQGPYNNIKEKKIINMRSIDTNKFYDFDYKKIACYWSNTPSDKKNHYLAGCFEQYRYKVELDSRSWRGRTRYQYERSQVKETGFYSRSIPEHMYLINKNFDVGIGLRLVRDIK